jgi:arylsulfatase A-like enzyme
VGDDPDHPGGDVWATNATLDVMDNEEWSGIFVTLPGVDKAAHMWGGVNDPGPTGTDGVAMTHLDYAADVADEQVGRIIAKLRADHELDNTLVVLTADHGSVGTAYAEDGTFPGEHFHGAANAAPDHGLKNWYYGNVENDSYLDPQPALQDLVATGNVGFSYNDSGIQTWLIDQSLEKKNQAAAIMATMPDVTAVWRNDGDHFTRVSPIRYGLMTTKAERKWFDLHAQELVDTQAAPYGPDLIATLADNTTYSVAGDHGGIQRAAQQIPIVFAGGGVGSRDIMAPVRSVDIMPTILKALGIKPTAPMDGIAYPLPR